jgi:hypothetical protein
MKNRNINKTLQAQVKKYMEYMEEEKARGTRNDLNSLSILSKRLKDELLYDIYGKLFKNYNLFNNNFSPVFLKKLSLKMKEILFPPDDIIFKVKKTFIFLNIF